MYGGAEGQDLRVTALVLSYDPATNSWQDEVPMTSARSLIKGIYCRGKIYAIGGSSRHGELDSCEAYDIEASRWQPIASLPRPLSGYEAVVWRDSLIYVIGGVSDVAVTASVWVYDPLNDKWMEGDSMLSPLAFGDACLVGDSIYTAGGFSGSSYEGVMRVGWIRPGYPLRISWSRGPGMPERQAYGPVVSMDRKVYWFGGALQGSGSTRLGYVYDPESGTITSLPDYPANVMSLCLAVARESHGEIYGLAGDGGSEYAGYYRLAFPGYYDVGPTRMSSPSTRVDSGDTVHPAVVVGNFGRHTEGFRVLLRIDSSWADFESTTVAPGETAVVRFGPWNAVTPGTHVVKCSTMLQTDNQPGNDVLYDTLEVEVFSAGISGLVLPDSIVEGEYTPTATVTSYGSVPGSVRVCWQMFQDDTFHVYAQSESTYLEGHASRQIWFTPWNAVEGSYLAKVFAVHRGRVCRDTVQKHFRVVSAGIAEETGAQISSLEFRLEVVSANPGRNDLAIRYSLPHSSDVDLRLFDASGKCLAILAEGRALAGRHYLSLDPMHSVHRIPSGICFIRLQADGLVETRKVLFAQ
jgi:hypothetical protein